LVKKPKPSIVDLLLTPSDEIDAEHKEREHKIARLFKKYDIDAHASDAWESLALVLAERYEPNFSSTRRQGQAECAK
jgi:hypothetical protein